MILVDAQKISASRPGKPLFADLSLTVASGDRLGVVGLNGCGKSTLLRALAGHGEPESGQVHWGRGTHRVMLDQDDDLPAGTVGSVVGHHWEASAVLDRLGMTPFLDRDVTTLSGGQRKRTALARALVAVENLDSDLLLLDEPTNHLDVDAIEWLEKRLARFTGALVMVTHDRHVLDRVTTKVLELDRGKGYLHAASTASGGSGYQAYLEARALREEQSVANEQVRRNLARTELAWLRRGAPARTSKPKARIDAAVALLNSGPEAAVRGNTLDLGQLGTQRLGTKVVELHDAGHRWNPDGPWLFRHLDLILEPGDRLGVVGANGAGKSTLLDVLDGRVKPAEGRMEVGT
ncbi:MAG: ATPase component of transporter with duplicated ATPase domain, partial [Acidimicrobiia bacterium]|nr:ATPase component of transporter with duplicated ATPase domain [Acidimicrobiia bacterium]